jgi:hypothetical protein
MARTRGKVKRSAPAPRDLPTDLADRLLQGRRWLVALVLALLPFYLVPLFASAASIQWDAVDVHYSLQKYFADRIHEGELPFWTPYVFSGFPFLADPQVGAFYPLHWPFFLLGITPRAIQWELALHAFLACAGAYLLFLRLTGHRAASLTGALAYGLSGFFAGHSSHVGIFEAASLLPWLLLCLKESLDSGFWRYCALGGAVGGMIVLAGHFQTALYGFAAAGLFAVAELVRSREHARRTAGFLAVSAGLAILLSAIVTLPGLELAARSIRAEADFSQSREGVLQPGALPTLLWPDSLGVISGRYAGPGDVTQYYFYGGLLLLPLAALGLRRDGARLHALLLILPTAWYMLGPAAGLYRIGAFLPGFYKVRAPVHAWFVIALGLALLAAAGARRLAGMKAFTAVSLLLPGLFVLDLCYWNSWRNPLAYGRARFEENYGGGEVLASRVAASLAPMTRLHGPNRITAFGSMNHPLDVKLEATYGYNPLQLSLYSGYLESIPRNAKLRDGLNAGRVVDAGRNAILDNPSVLPRAYFAPEVVEARDTAESLRLLAELDPGRRTIVLGKHPSIRQDPAATATISVSGMREYRIRYRAASTSLLRVSVPYYPGWGALTDAAECPVVPVDHALLGVIVPAGEKELTLRFQSRYFPLGAGLSGAGVVLALMAGFGRRFLNRKSPRAPL